MPAEAVLFDIDGTLIDSVDLHARAWQEALAHFGHRVDLAAIRSQIGKGGDQLLPVFVSEDEIARRGKIIEDYRGDLYKREYMKRVRPFPGVRALFRELSRRGVRIALASSAKGDELQTYEHLVGVEDRVHAESSKDDASRSKPHPDIFVAALAQLGSVDPKRVLVVGDSPWDAIAAKRAGLRTVGVLCGGFPEDDLRQAGCVAIYRDPEDLHARLDESPLMR